MYARVSVRMVFRKWARCGFLKLPYTIPKDASAKSLDVGGWVVWVGVPFIEWVSNSEWDGW